MAEIQSNNRFGIKQIILKIIKIFVILYIIVLVCAVITEKRSTIENFFGISNNQQEESETTNANDTYKNTVVESKIVATMKVKAEVFRIVNNHFKDTYRKEEIYIDIDSEGRFFLSGSNKLHYAMGASISSIRGYEYEIWYIEPNGDKLVYAFNKDEMQKVKGMTIEETLDYMKKLYEKQK
ncbi:MAG: hypothetical protein IKM77_04705 [Prevotella sp.]|nr:hypothetical protein [Prevotella sp.]